MTVQLTEASPRDAALLHGITQTAFAEYSGQFNPPFACLSETLDDVGAALLTGSALLAWIDGDAVGAARYATQAGALHISRVAVLPAWRGCGVASALMTALEQRGLALGCESLTLTTRLSLPRNVALYERCGFQIVERWQCAPDADVQVRMTKTLLADQPRSGSTRFLWKSVMASSSPSVLMMNESSTRTPMPRSG